jgi:hypothetical protein
VLLTLKVQLTLLESLLSSLQPATKATKEAPIAIPDRGIANAESFNRGAPPAGPLGLKYTVNKLTIAINCLNQTSVIASQFPRLHSRRLSR